MWNVWRLSGKEIELIKEFEEVYLSVLAITETKKEGKSIQEMENGHIMLLSGVGRSERAHEGVGCIIERNFTKHLIKWE